ncbi:hypothetical protein H2199_003854 [Coniosporium tulheliwenetii]|uniref:Uncharacterized protein n=1 Tax=Coniosporium tulheliwenetii TaxID=3383036 RepID=A0ACC2Z9P9_9PEZI|nr:hypothetical protein H2199_003854 [Cladosporium sp. JES 115]
MSEKALDHVLVTAGVESPDSASLDMEDKAVMAQMGKKQQLAGLAILNWPDYGYERWHSTLMMWAIVAITFAINVWGIKLLPATELFAGICHVLFFVAVSVPMLVLGRNASPDLVFKTYINQTGWSNDGVAFFIGLLPCVWCIVGFDGAIHLSEETTKSATTIPKVIMTTVVLNGTLAWLFVLVSLYSISSIDDALGTPTGFPIIEILRQATGSAAAATLMETAMLAVGIAALMGTLASVSRLTWAFARDKGLPFSDFFAHVDGHYHIPTRAISLVAVVVVLLSFINIGSSVALSAILSLSTISLYLSYIIPIACLLLKRLRVSTRRAAPGQAFVGEDAIVFGPFSLGRFGVLVNLYALCYACVMVPFLTLPTVLPLTKETMNYAGPVLGLVLLFAAVDYHVRGKRKFHGPRREFD